ncbi:MAG: DUF72 domain-containing protein [Candidatus Schekmanbacteria bacterium]|nr:DUF72 domain-containing protein [Candidatus Schekmanbacteria bacterium]
MISIGTSGFSYDDWRGAFYPDKMPQGEFLAYYSKYFDTCELNFSYYRMPDSNIFERMLEKSGGKVSFSVKAFQDITHKPQCPPEIIRQFKDSLSPLVDEGKLAALLFQFPYSFKDVSAGMKYITVLNEEFNPLPMVVEFRNRVWISENTFSFLKEKNIGYVCVDEPQLKGLMPPVGVSTSDVAYVRFHGRNSEKWWDHKEAFERYDYSYTDAELAGWVPKIKALDEKSKSTLVYMNNHYRGNAVKNAKRLREIMESDK